MKRTILYLHWEVAELSIIDFLSSRYTVQCFILTFLWFIESLL